MQNFYPELSQCMGLTLAWQLNLKFYWENLPDKPVLFTCDKEERLQAHCRSRSKHDATGKQHLILSAENLNKQLPYFSRLLLIEHPALS